VLAVHKVTPKLKATLAAIAPGSLPQFLEVDCNRIQPPMLPDRVVSLKRYKGVTPRRMPKGMAWVPPARFRQRIEHRWHGSTCYDFTWPKAGKWFDLPGFAIDIYPVTNAQFAEFLRDSGYAPADRRHFLKHWKAPKPPADKLDHPVVWVGPDDARAYAAWAGKRLPREAELQYAGQGLDGRLWPWGNDFDDALTNATGATRPVGACPGDASPFGLHDLVGHVWHWVEDTYTDRMNKFTVLKGGSFFRLPKETSMWYHLAGPQPLVAHAKIHLIAPCQDRFGTVGFRCVID